MSKISYICNMKSIGNLLDQYKDGIYPEYQFIVSKSISCSLIYKEEKYQGELTISMELIDITIDKDHAELSEGMRRKMPGRNIRSDKETIS